MDNPKGCPFCGAVPVLGFKRTSDEDYCALYVDHSYDCFFRALLSDNVEIAVGMSHNGLIEKWNGRINDGSDSRD